MNKVKTSKVAFLFVGFLFFASLAFALAYASDIGYFIVLAFALACAAEGNVFVAITMVLSFMASVFAATGFAIAALKECVVSGKHN